MRKLVRTLKVLSDEARLRALNLVFERECCVCEVMQVLQISQSKASRILSAIYDVGIFKLRKEGRCSVYSLDQSGMTETMSQLVVSINQVCKEEPVAMLDRERLKTTKRFGERCNQVMKAEALSE